MERLKQLFFDFNNSKEYRELGETPEARQSIDAFYSFAEKHISGEEFHQLESIFTSSTLYNEMQGWTYGFRYAVQLMSECFPKKGGVSNALRPQTNPLKTDRRATGRQTPGNP